RPPDARWPRRQRVRAVSRDGRRPGPRRQPGPRRLSPRQPYGAEPAYPSILIPRPNTSLAHPDTLGVVRPAKHRINGPMPESSGRLTPGTTVARVVLSTMTNFLRDVRFGVRLLGRNPGFAAVAILALALGIGATAAIFSVVYATLLAPLPYPQPDQLVMVWSRVQGNRNVSAAGTYLEWKRRSSAFQSLNAWTGGSVNLATSDRPEHVPVATTTPGFLSMVGTPL